MSTLLQQADDINKSLALLGMEFQVAKLEAKGRRQLQPNGVESEVAGIFDFEGKAMPTTGGGQVIEGQAGGVDIDRSLEAFEPGVLAKSAAKFMRTNPVLCYHHHVDEALGVVEQMGVNSNGKLYARARLDEPEPHTKLADVFRKVKSGTIKGLSVGGIFRRKMTPQGMRIHDFDMYELSVTPVPMEPGSLFTLAGKALSNESGADRLKKLAELRAAMDRAVVL
jgi:HK97 family phage prohead protease